MPATVIRKIRKADNEVLARIIRNTFEEFRVPTAGTVYEDPTTDDLYNLFNRPGAVCWVAWQDNEIAGCAGIYPTAALPVGCCEFVKFYLAGRYRGEVTGYQLMRQCIESAAALGYRRIYLESMPEFSRAVGLYEKTGFRPLAAPMGNSGHFGCTIWMIKELY